jgi:hypothetical protein
MDDRGTTCCFCNGPIPPDQYLQVTVERGDQWQLWYSHFECWIGVLAEENRDIAVEHESFFPEVQRDKPNLRLVDEGPNHSAP